MENKNNVVVIARILPLIWVGFLGARFEKGGFGEGG